MFALVTRFKPQRVINFSWNELETTISIFFSRNSNFIIFFLVQLFSFLDEENFGFSVDWGKYLSKKKKTEFFEFVKRIFLHENFIIVDEDE